MRTQIARHTLLVAAALAAMFAVGGLSQAGAQAQGTCNLPAQYQGSVTFAASVTSAVPGQTITFTGSGWPANTTIPITINGASVGTTTTNASGQFSFTYTVPASASGTLTASVDCGAVVVSSSVSVSSGSASTALPVQRVSTGSTLPVTGSQAIGFVQVALALLAAGGLALLLARRRASAAND